MISLAAALLLASAPPGATLAVESGGAWHAWWRADRAPARWTAPHPRVAGAVEWRTVAEGVEAGELRLSAPGEAWRTRVILLRFAPARVSVDLERRDGWSLDAAPQDALAAFNAGQFSAGRPWGWVVDDGREIQAPGRGPLSMAVVVDASGRFQWLEADSIEAFRSRGEARAALQSYPVLLRRDGEVPEALRGEGRGVDLTHRDSRLAIGELRDGRVVVALTRFDALNGVLSSAPFGPTIPELAAIMGAMGCRRAVALDGGISGQMMVRERRYEAWRRVPLGIVLRAR